MGYSVYLESSIVDLKPRVLDFLSALVEKAKDVKDYALSMKKKEMAELVGKDTRTISRYLTELEKNNVIQMKGKKGRAGGTVILLNAEMIKFETSDQAILNSDDILDINRVMEEKMPKKKIEKKEKTRARRTKKQMAEDNLLERKRNNAIKELNDEIFYLGGVPDWDWFKKTDKPVENYRTYLIAKLYNRYAALFTDRHNAEVEVYGNGKLVDKIGDEYDVLPLAFYKSSRWNQFEKFREFCEANDIQPEVYLTSQFTRSMFSYANGYSKGALPFCNALISSASYKVYQQYVDYRKKVSHAYSAWEEVPAKYMDDFVVRSIVDAYDSAEQSNGYLSVRHYVEDFLMGDVSGEKEEALYDFYRITDANLKNKNVSTRSRDSIKKFILTQSLILTGGSANLPQQFILSLETTRALLHSIDINTESKEDARSQKALALGTLVIPNQSHDVKMKIGSEYLYQMATLNETPQVLRLIMKRKGLYLSVVDIANALQDYGRDKLPLDAYSVLDIDQIVKFVNRQYDVVDHDVITQKEEYQLSGQTVDPDKVDNLFDDL